jgi:hypothetical protein
MTAWRANGFPERPARARVLKATDEHDLGWQVADAAPRVNPETGTPHSFMDAPLEVSQGVWPRAVDQLTPQDSYVAALVAHHGLTVYRRFEHTPGWEEFFPAMERRRDDLLGTDSPDFDAFLQDYAIVAIGDLCSLVFCNGWQEPYSREGYQAALHVDDAISSKRTDPGVVHGGWLEISPDPFEGAIVPLEVPARRVPARHYESDADLRDTVARAPVIHLTGIAHGASSSM